MFAFLYASVSFLLYFYIFMFRHSQNISDVEFSFRFKTRESDTVGMARGSNDGDENEMGIVCGASVAREADRIFVVVQVVLESLCA